MIVDLRHDRRSDRPNPEVDLFAEIRVYFLDPHPPVLTLFVAAYFVTPVEEAAIVEYGDIAL
jgi:hypothetical protein